MPEESLLMSETAKRNILSEIIVHADFPRASHYDPAWVFDTGMGWPVMWATEALTEQMELKPGMRVLDLGCGKAASSVFLAREYGVEVWAAELWISPTDNYRMLREQGVDDKVLPISADVHALPFAHAYFDAIVSLGAYHYFGTDDYLLMNLIRFLKPGGQLGFVSPGFSEEFERNGVPAHLQQLFTDDGHGQGWYSFHSPAWWRWHWEKTGLVDIAGADMVPGGWALWKQYDEIVAEMSDGNALQADTEALQQDQGRYLGFVRMLARRAG
jgi:SAM-dependent methyltransferase